MRSHVVRSFERVAEMPAVLGYEAFKEIGKIERDVRVRVLLNDERTGGVLDKSSKDSIEWRLPAQPILNRPGERVETLAFCGNGDLGVGGGQER